MAGTYHWNRKEGEAPQIVSTSWDHTPQMSDQAIITLNF